MSLNTLLESANPYQSLQSDAARLASKWEKNRFIRRFEWCPQKQYGSYS